MNHGKNWIGYVPLANRFPLNRRPHTQLRQSNNWNQKLCLTFDLRFITCDRFRSLSFRMFAIVTEATNNESWRNSMNGKNCPTSIGWHVVWMYWIRSQLCFFRRNSLTEFSWVWTWQQRRFGCSKQTREMLESELKWNSGVAVIGI